MINGSLYIKEMKKSVIMLLIFGGILLMYVSIIIGMYDPEMMAALESFYGIMPELMASVGMTSGATTLIGFMVSYLYGFILLIFPMLFCILRGNGLIAKYTDNGSMAVLISAPVKRKTVVLTQLSVLLSGVIILVTYITCLELSVCAVKFRGQLAVGELLKLNLALLFLHLFIAGICFFFSCLFSDTKYSIAFGAGVPAFMYVLQMLANVGEKTEAAKYFTFFTLFDAEGIAANQAAAFGRSFILLAGAIILYIAGTAVFCKKDICL